MNATPTGCAAIPVSPAVDLNYCSRDRQLRLVLCAGELHRMRPPHTHVRVVFGTAYVSQGGRDIIVAAGECMTIDDAADAALISGLGKQPLIVELHS